VDSDILAAMVANGTAGAIGTTVAITEANVQAARKNLTVAKATSGKRHIIVHPTQANNLLGITNFVQWTALGQPLNLANGSVGAGNGSPDYNQYMGRIYNFNVWESQLITVPAGVGKNVYFNENAVLFASRKMYPVPAGMGAQTVSVEDPSTGIALNMTYSYNPLAGAMQCTLELLYGIVLERPTFAGVISTN
jgi:hypothetical protein